ncbi:MAG: DUF2806 domain-containing protein [Eubacteriales bacterium]
MNEMKDISEAAKALSAPVVKLIEVCAVGIGKIYEPIHTSRMARANAEAYKILSEAISENPIIPVTYKEEKLALDASDTDSIFSRMKDRVQFQEIKKQINIENVISEAYLKIKEEEQVSNDKVDEDWITRFFNYAGEVSNNEMQIIWGSILSGEIKQPGSFSLRTLEILRSISQKEAKIFHKVSAYAIKNLSQKYHYIYKDDDLLSKFGINFLDIVALADIGLLSRDLVLSLDCKNKPTMFAKYNNWFIFLESNIDKTVSFSICKYTTVGEELLTINNPHIKSINYFKEIALDLNKQNVKLSFAEIYSDINPKGKKFYREPLKYL